MSIKQLRSSKRIDRAAPWVFIAPASLMLVLLSIVPVFYSLYISFQRYNLAKPVSTIRFYGMQNYIRMLTSDQFLGSIQWTLQFALVSLCIEIPLGMAIAVALNSDRMRRLASSYKTLFILPMMIAPVVSATIWKIMFYPIYGVVNNTLSLLGLNPVNWLGEVGWAKLAIIIVEVWSATPFCVLVFTAALKTVPQDMLEAAKVDGASAFRSFFSITLPTIRNFVALVATIRLSDALRAFDVVMQLTNGAPGVSTETIGTTIYKTAFRYNDVGQGSAGAFIFFIIISVVSLLSLRIMRKQDR